MTALASRGRRERRRVRHAAALVTAGCALAGAPATAQRIFTTVDVGGAHVRYADTVTTNAAVVTPEVRFTSARTSAGATGTFSQGGGGDWTTQGTVDAAVTVPVRGTLSAELGGVAGGSTRHDGVRTGQATAMLRAYVSHAGTVAAGAWLGGGGGGAWDGFVHRSVMQGEAGAWVTRGATSATVSVSPTRVDDTLRYADAQVALGWSAGIVRLDALAGLRGGGTGISLDPTTRQWGSLGVTAQLRDRIAVVASAGTYPVDLTQGFPGGRFATLGVRFTVAPRRTTPVGTGGTGAVGRPAATMSFEAVTRLDGVTTLRVYARNATSVDVAGDFTNWKPVACRPKGNGWWTAALPIGRGTHQMNVRLNGGAWQVPPGLTTVTDEFGGTVGVLDIRS